MNGVMRRNYQLWSVPGAKLKRARRPKKVKFGMVYVTLIPCIRHSVTFTTYDEMEEVWANLDVAQRGEFASRGIITWIYYVELFYREMLIY